MTAKYAINESVIITLCDKPIFDSVITAVEHGQFLILGTNQTYHGHAYKVTNFDGYIAEPSIKKKHKPGSLNFTQLLEWARKGIWVNTKKGTDK